MVVVVVHGSLKGIALTRVTVVIRIVPHDLVPGTFQGPRIEIGDRRGRRRRFGSIFIRSTGQNRYFDTFVIFNGAFQEIIEIFVAIACHTSRNTGIVAQTFGRTRQSFPAIGIVD